mmetsp:Transcript_93742/g.286830  ORF Transcript_93742/g.286830 Transcript_93742/m.286830 type:complete len:218 (-) Transcript_93742:982-1635(-)
MARSTAVPAAAHNGSPGVDGLRRSCRTKKAGYLTDRRRIRRRCSKCLACRRRQCCRWAGTAPRGPGTSNRAARPLNRNRPPRPPTRHRSATAETLVCQPVCGPHPLATQTTRRTTAPATARCGTPAGAPPPAPAHRAPFWASNALRISASEVMVASAAKLAATCLRRAPMPRGLAARATATDRRVAPLAAMTAPLTEDPCHPKALCHPTARAPPARG